MNCSRPGHERVVRVLDYKREGFLRTNQVISQSIAAPQRSLGKHECFVADFKNENQTENCLLCPSDISERHLVIISQIGKLRLSAIPLFHQTFKAYVKTRSQTEPS